MATTGKIFSDSSNIYQDQARLLFNYYDQAAERIVRQEEALEKQIKELEEDREQVELKKSDILYEDQDILVVHVASINKEILNKCKHLKVVA